MKHVVIGAHLLREDIEPLADAIPAAELFVSGIGVPDDQPLGDRALLLRIASVRAKLTERATFVAIRYGLAIASETEATSKIAAHASRWKALLETHRDHVEMTLKVAAFNAQSRPDRHEFKSGADYLRALHAAVRSANVRPAFLEAVERLLLPLAVRSRWQNRDEKSAEWNALVRRGNVAAIQESAAKLREECSDTPFLFSGPWPLEVFADDDHE
jgi:hypothetical protein